MPVAAANSVAREDRRDEERAVDTPEDELHGVEQPVHEPGALQHVAHEREHRHGGEHRVGHRVEDLVGHQVEDPVSQPDVAEHHAEEDQRERDRKAAEDHHEEHAEQDQAQDLVAHERPPVTSAMTLRRAHRGPRGAVVDARAQRLDAFQDLGEALQQDEGGAHRDHRLVPVRRRAPRRHQGLLQVPGLGGELPAHPREHHHPGQEEEQVLRDVHAHLCLERPVLREEVRADVLLQMQRVGRGQEEMRPVAHGGDVVRPDGRRAELAHHHLVEEHDEHRDDEPGGRLARQGAHAVDDVRDAVDPVHGLWPPPRLPAQRAAITISC